MPAYDQTTLALDDELEIICPAEGFNVVLPNAYNPDEVKRSNPGFYVSPCTNKSTANALLSAALQLAMDARKDFDIGVLRLQVSALNLTN